MTAAEQEEARQASEAVAVERRLFDWLAYGDAGMSSKTLAQCLSGYPTTRYYGSTPADWWDFDRCRKLLDVFPEWRPRLHEAAAIGPEWARLVAAWSVVEAEERTSERSIAVDAAVNGAASALRWAARNGHDLLKVGPLVERIEAAVLATALLGAAGAGEGSEP